MRRLNPDVDKRHAPAKGLWRMRNSAHTYGLIAILLHWVVAVTVFGLFALGLWMTDLTYYDDWYRRAPELHKGIGVLLFLLMLVRLTWRWMNPVPAFEPDTGRLQRKIAQIVHRLLYLLLFALMFSGYLISSADGRGIEVFGLFEVPALISDIPNLEDTAGKLHWILAITLMALIGLHAAAALKHHFIDRDQTLKRMLVIRSFKP